MTLIRGGVGRGSLQGNAWRRVARGFYVPASAGWICDNADDGSRPERLSTAQRILDATPRLSGRAALGTWAAAYVHGVDWLDGRSPHTMTDLPVDIIAPDLKRRSTRDIKYHGSELAAMDRVSKDGFPITSMVRTAFDGARWADSLEEAVVFIDSMLAFGKLHLPRLNDYVVEHTGWPGVEKAAAAARLARFGVRSGWETRLRMCWLIDAHLPDPLVNVPIFDRSEKLLGIADLFDPDSGLVAEFDGEQHREPGHHRKDNIREEELESANLVVVRSDKVDVRTDRPQLISRLIDGYRRGQRRDRRWDRWTLTQPDWWLTRQSRRDR